MQTAALLAAAAVVLAAPAAHALTLEEAIALAVGHEPGLRRAAAEQDAASARLRQARAARLPSVTLEGSIAEAHTDFGGFFGFGAYDLTPSSAAVTARQLVFDGGGASAGVRQAKEGEAGARAAVDAARLNLAADVAEAFEAVLTGERALELRQAEIEALSVAADHARRRFDAGEAPSTEMEQAQARLSEARAGLARSQGDLAQARARFRTLTGQEPAGLEAVGALPPAPAQLEDAVSLARDSSPAVLQARSAVAAAEAGVRRAKSAGAPTVAAVAQASSVRDQFLPGYRADGGSIGLQARWPLFTSGLNTGQVDEARANLRAAEASLDQARATAEEAAIRAWQGLQTADAVARAAADQAKAADAARDSVGHEVRVGMKPTLDLLDAERDALAAHLALLQAQGARVVAAYRLKAATGAKP